MVQLRARTAALAGALLLPLVSLVPSSALPARVESPTPSPTPVPSAQPLAGRVVALDPGHQLGATRFPRQLQRRVDGGPERTRCDTVGATTRGGYPEATVAWRVVGSVRQQLEALGAQVMLTRSRNSVKAFGPCVDARARTANAAGADLVISVHASDRAPARHGFRVLEPADLPGWTSDVRADSARLALAARAALLDAGLTAGSARAAQRKDLAVFNLSDVPVVQVELGNLRNRADARALTSTSGRATYAAALVVAVTGYLAPVDQAPASTTTTSPSAPQPTPPAAAGGGAELGVQLFSMWRDWDTHTQLMDEVAASGSRWLRVDVGWCSLEEHGRGVVSPWYRDRLDATVADATARGLKLLVTLTCAPTWATPGGREGVLPSDPADYARVATYLASRYRGRIAAWEVWNEPDCIGGCTNGDPVAYVRLLRAAYPAFKAADPAAVVMNGGLSGIDLGWIRRMYDAGAGGYLDALALHPYLAPADAGPATAAAAGWTNPYRMTNVSAARDLLASLGHADTPMWFTEFGWTTGRTPGSPYDGVTPAQQAAYLTEAMAMLRLGHRYVTHAFWFTLRDRDDSTVYENDFGLLRLDGTPKPSWAAFVAAVAR